MSAKSEQRKGTKEQDIEVFLNQGKVPLRPFILALEEG
jgi:hypothetical protein